MEANLNSELWNLLLVFLALAGIALVVAVLLGVYIIWRVRRINLPATADIATALRASPLSVVLVLDLLDYALDFFSAPIAWALLSRLGLLPLRGVATLKSIIPLTQFFPIMTAAWIGVRVFDRGSRLTNGRTVPRLPR